MGLDHVDAHQHPPAAEAHHAQPALEHEALVVSGSDARLESFGAADSVSFLGLPLWVVHPLHVLSQFVFPLHQGITVTIATTTSVTLTAILFATDRNHNVSCSDTSLAFSLHCCCEIEVHAQQWTRNNSEFRLTVQKLRLLSHKKQSQTNAKLVASIEVNPSNLAFL